MGHPTLKGGIGIGSLPEYCGRHSMAAGKQSRVSVADVVLGTAGPLAKMSDEQWLPLLVDCYN